MPSLPDSGSPGEVVDSRVDVAEQEHVDASAQVRTVDEVVERMRVDDWTTGVHHNVRLSVLLLPSSLRPRPLIGTRCHNVLPRLRV